MAAADGGAQDQRAGVGGCGSLRRSGDAGGGRRWLGPRHLLRRVRHRFSRCRRHHERRRAGARHQHGGDAVGLRGCRRLRGQRRISARRRWWRSSCSPATRRCVRSRTTSTAVRSAPTRPKPSTACTSPANRKTSRRRAISSSKSSSSATIPFAISRRLSEGEELIELAATLVPTTANPEDLDAITRHLERHDSIDSATWTVSTES